jgi:putative SOS response-associated peptidase YedK
MCGRFAAFSSADVIADRLGLAVISAGARLLPPNWNVAPTNLIPVVTPDFALQTARWGLQTPRSHSGMGIINARAESVAHKASFAADFANRRCLVPADGYYEWQKISDTKKKKKQPWYITNADQSLQLFAGIFNNYNDELTVAITTTAANAEMEPIHHRMPVVLPESAMETWLNGSETEAEHLLLHTPQHLAMHPVSTLVNNVRNNSAELIAAVAARALRLGSGPGALLDEAADITLF